MKKSICILAAIAILIFIAGCATVDDEANASSIPKVYTHEDLTSLPSDQLLNLFIEHGLEVNDALRSHFTEEELQELFKAEFETLCMGISARSGDIMYFDLAEQTKIIYEEITRPN